MSRDLHSSRGKREVDLVVQLAHDVRSPVSAVVALTGALRDELEAVISDRQRYQFNLIYNAALQLEYLVSDLIELTRPAEELLLLAPAPFSTLAMLEGVRDFLQPLAELGGATIYAHSTVLPDLRLGRASVIGRVLLNLAAPALRSGGPAGVSLTARPVDDTVVEFAVRCEEAVLDPEIVDRMREVALGRQARDASCFSNLGLELAFHLVELLQSSLDATFPPEGGMLYTMRLQVPPLPEGHEAD